MCEKGKQCAFAYTGYANSTEGQKLDEKTAAEPMVTSVGVGNLVRRDSPRLRKRSRKMRFAAHTHTHTHATPTTPT